MRFKSDSASLIVGRKFTVFVLLYFVFGGNFPSTSPRGLYLEGRFNAGFLALLVWGGFGGAYTWRGLFSEFYGTLIHDLFQQYLYFLKTGFYCTPLLFSSVKNQHKTFLEHFSAAMAGKNTATVNLKTVIYSIRRSPTT